MNNIFKSHLCLVLSLFVFLSCDSENKTINQGNIEYEISYPCLEKNHESLMFLLPKNGNDF